jgi:NADP-dependent aldehyde dehydrogenase
LGYAADHSTQKILQRLLPGRWRRVHRFVAHSEDSIVQLTGKSFIGYQHATHQGKTFCGSNPATGESLTPLYYSAHLAEVDSAAHLAFEAFAHYGRIPGRERASFLRCIAGKLELLGEDVISRSTQETGLPAARIKSETARTCFQLRLFADLVEEGSWVDARIDRRDPSRRPLPRPDIRSMQRPLGPVAVFGASNFPIAFSVAGGDTASALAAGNPVIVKAHPSHPGTSELVGLAVLDAARECHLPDGVFSLLFDEGFEIGLALVKHPLIKAVGFTGSRAGGDALVAAAASRPEPIPVYAEMGSINPVFIFPGALHEKEDQLATGLHASVTLGAGQFCTNPGLVVMEDGPATKSFSEKLGALMSSSPEFTMLSTGIGSAYRSKVDERARQQHVQTLALKEHPPQANVCRSTAALFMTDARAYLNHPELSEEIFGPATLMVTYSSRDQLIEIARSMGGQLTATIHGTEEDIENNKDLISILETKVGRLVFNGFPTGVEVCHAMVHGGPYPATSDGRSTSVGTRAIHRFVRPVCYQDFPDTALPDELKDNNPAGIWRLVDARWTKDPLEPGAK